ncbi:MAG: SoxR reducing system RseC family protein [Tannerellaceae bacterium]|jgi:sigma-E factor negative regulatory protein RseC|nr:SoxR reducing system RseC family protein [Tannerellaceae bacterium]
MTNRDNSTNFCGTIDRISGQTAYVKIMPAEACASCAAQSLCSPAARKPSVVEAAIEPGMEPLVNSKVTLSLGRMAGPLSAALAFFIPLAVVTGVIFLAVALLGWDEAEGASAGLSAGAFWYAGLYLCRGALRKKLVFTIKET